MPVDHVVRAAQCVSRFLSVCFDWIAGGGKKDEWDRKLLIEPRTLRLFRRRVDGPGAASD